MNTITIENILLHTIIGLSKEERTNPQDLFITLTLKHARTEGADDIMQTLDYVPICEEIYALTSFQPKLIETFAEHILAICLREHRVHEATVTVKKPAALQSGVPSVTLKASK